MKYVTKKRLTKRIYIDDPITKDIEEILDDDNGVNLDDLIHKLQELKDKYQEKELRLDIDGEFDIDIFSTRLETDEEYNRRIKKEEKDYKEVLRKSERDKAFNEEFLKLREKYYGHQ